MHLAAFRQSGADFFQQVPNPICAEAVAKAGVHLRITFKAAFAEHVVCWIFLLK
jgi:hypothetical protein